MFCSVLVPMFTQGYVWSPLIRPWIPSGIVWCICLIYFIFLYQNPVWSFLNGDFYLLQYTLFMQYIKLDICMRYSVLCVYIWTKIQRCIFIKRELVQLKLFTALRMTVCTFILGVLKHLMGTVAFFLKWTFKFICEMMSR